MKINRLKKVDSTNLEAQRLLDAGAVAPFVVFADEQTAGKGQGDHSWNAAPCMNLTCSFVLRPQLAVAEQYLVTVAASLAVKKTIQQLLPAVNPKIKWPNDVYVDDKKICGILISHKIIGSEIESSIIGIGLNVNQKVFPENIPNPVSMSQLSKKNYNIDEVLLILKKNIVEILNRVETDPIASVRYYTDNMYKLGEKSVYTVNGVQKLLTATGIDEYGGIVAEEDLL
ncbi:MAG: biotin--[acetyl-CoA-carboxylase] ligase [Bacteroidales bacterium]|nr:biotin--[acetyl-CoA-carboxylase] ligase [Bacteroidales bacterium]